MCVLGGLAHLVNMHMSEEYRLGSFAADEVRITPHSLPG